MSDAFDDRRIGLEEEYFHKKNQEAIAKLREKIQVSNEAKAAGAEMKCPRCGNDLKEHNVQNVTTNACSRCGGIWLDSGELEQLVQGEQGGYFKNLWDAFRSRNSG